jgi:hypothetical protein
VTSRPTRATVAGRTYLDLQNLARRQHRPTDELHQLYALEGFLTRLAASPHADRLVLKGGVLLAAYATRRPTRDVDLAARQVSNDIGEVLSMICAIAALPVDDGLEFDTVSAVAEGIRDDDAYSGVRVTLTCRLSAARLTFHVDVNVGDPIWPPPQRITLPRLLAGEITLTGYPLTMILTEKVLTVLERGLANTRWRDFADVYALCHQHDIDGAELTTSITRVAHHRQLRLTGLLGLLDAYAPLAQQRWTTWLRKNQLGAHLPADFQLVLDQVITFTDPPLTGGASGKVWRAATLAWQDFPHRD